MNLNVKGEIICDEWAELYRAFGYSSGFFAPGDLRSALDHLEEGEELVLEINSPGGLVDAASEIYSVIQSCGHPTRAVIQSIAASAASYLCLSCDRVEIARPAQMMIHCASWGLDGNKFDHKWAAKQLDAADRSILDVYAAKCGGKASREELARLMEAETYLPAAECLRLGLADAILGAEPEDDEPPLALTASVAGNLMRAMRTLPDIRELIDRREREQQVQPQIQPLQHADFLWQAAARLNLEQERYHTGRRPHREE